MSEKEDDILNYLSRELKMSKSVIARLALRDWMIAEEAKLSVVEELHKRAKERRKDGTQRRLLSKMNNLQANFDDLRAEVNDI